VTADPRQKRHRRQTIARAAIIGALGLALVSCPGWGGDSARTTLIMFAYYAALAQMWNLLAGYAGLVTFGQQLFIGVGAYSLAVGCERLGLGLWVAFALPAVVCGVLAVPVGALLFRL
jgi:branched-chain amino acid transport system permease protein